MARALVTGSTSGIGKAVAARLARDDFDVIVHGRDAARGAEVVGEIAAAGGRARFVAADLADLDALRRLADLAGDVDVLVNNSGIAWAGPTVELDVATFDLLFTSNVRATYFLVAAIAPRMVARGAGRIINIGSVVGQVGMPGMAAYGATKAAVSAMTRAWAAEFSGRGVLVNAVTPGPIRTGTGVRAERLEKLGATTLLQRTGTVEEIAAVVSFLASPGASYVTGAILAADGGRGAT